MSDQPRLPRRTVLRLSGSALAATALAGCTGGNGGDSGGGSGETTTTSDGGSGDAKTIRLGAKQSGWVGRKPKPIEGTKNPALSLRPGQKYELTWKNLDGKEHELLVVDDSDEEVVKTESSEEKGKIVTKTFTASKKMTEYYCEYHPKSMRGAVETK